MAADLQHSDAAHLRMGMFGGAFDPVHVTHLTLALQVTRILNLDRLIWVPTGHAWHKTRTLTSAHHRLAMLRLAFADVAAESDNSPLVARWIISTCEIDRAGASYTADTLAELQHGEAAQAHWFLVMGMDQFSALQTWHRWQEVISRCTLAVVGRAGAGAQPAPEVLAQARWELVPFDASNLSSTRIRHLAQNLGAEGCQKLAELVSPAVARYIKTHHLYETKEL